MAAITLNKIAKTYPNGVAALQDISLEILDGEFLVVIGPSGCGKSTLLRLVAGLENITDGDLQIADQRVNEIEPGDRDLAMVFQNYALYPHMRVYDNMAYGLKNRGMRKAEIRERIAQTAAMLQIEELLNRKPAQLSGGQRQRVAMGRAIVRQPRAFLLDEPLSNLDTKLRMHMRGELKKLHRNLATTFVYVTHDQIEAMSLGDRIVVMNKGHIEQVGTPDVLYQQPSNLFVAQFIGSPGMNIIQTDQGYIGFRPEQARIGQTHANQQAHLTFAGPISRIEIMGPERFIYCSGIQNALDDQDICIKTTSDYPVAIDQTISIQVNKADCSRFDQHGRAIQNVN